MQNVQLALGCLSLLLLKFNYQCSPDSKLNKAGSQNKHGSSQSRTKIQPFASAPNVQVYLMKQNVELKLTAVFAIHQCSSKQNRSWIMYKGWILKVRLPNSSTNAKRRPLLMFFLQKLNFAVEVDGKNRPEPMLLRNRCWINYQSWFAILKTENNVFFALYITTGLCAGWEIEFRLPGTAADWKYKIEVKNKSW